MAILAENKSFLGCRVFQWARVCLPELICVVFFLVCYWEECDFSYYKENAHTDTFLIRCIWEYGCGTVSGESGELLQETNLSWHLPCLRQGLLLFATSHTTMFVTLTLRNSPALDSHIATGALGIIQKLPSKFMQNQKYLHACTAMICQQSHLTILHFFLVVFIFLSTHWNEIKYFFKKYHWVNGFTYTAILLTLLQNQLRLKSPKIDLGPNPGGVL